MNGRWQSKCHQDWFRRKTNLELDSCSDGISTQVQMISFPPFTVWRSDIAKAVENSFYCSCFALTFYLNIVKETDISCHSNGIKWFQGRSLIFKFEYWHFMFSFSPAKHQSEIQTFFKEIKWKKRETLFKRGCLFSVQCLTFWKIPESYTKRFFNTQFKGS